MKKKVFFFLLILTITVFSEETIPSKDINVMGESVKIHIKSYDGDSVQLEQVSNSNPKIGSIVKDTNTIKITLNDLKVKQKKIFKFKKKFNILVPQDENYKIFIIANNSLITIDDIDGDLKIIGKNTKVISNNTSGQLDIKTTYQKIVIKNADRIGKISTSNASIYAEFRKINDDSLITTQNSSIELYIPKNHLFNFSIFGDLVHIKNEFKDKDEKKFLILGTSNGTIRIKAQKEQ